MRGAEDFVVFGQRHFQGDMRRVVRGPRDEIGGFPAKYFLGEPGQIRNRRGTRVVVRQTFQESLVIRRDVAVHIRLGLDHRRDRHDQAHRLNVAEPLLMRDYFRIFGCHANGLVFPEFNREAVPQHSPGSA